jgi:hypothetical protein
MKRLLVCILLIAATAGCGAGPDSCPSGDDLCHFIIGGKHDEEVDKQLADLRARIFDLERVDEILRGLISALTSSTGYSLAELIDQAASLQEQLAGVRTELYEITTGNNIVGIVDPCGPSGGLFDEVFLRSGNGQLIASFGTGNSVRFSILVPGNYVTTDGTNCQFSVDADNVVTPSTERR